MNKEILVNISARNDEIVFIAPDGRKYSYCYGEKLDRDGNPTGGNRDHEIYWVQKCAAEKEYCQIISNGIRDNNFDGNEYIDDPEISRVWEHIEKARLIKRYLRRYFKITDFEIWPNPDESRVIVYDMNGLPDSFESWSARITITERKGEFILQINDMTKEGEIWDSHIPDFNSGDTYYEWARLNINTKELIEALNIQEILKELINTKYLLKLYLVKGDGISLYACE